MSERQKKRNEDDAADAIERVIASLDRKSEDRLDAEFGRLNLGNDQGIERSKQNLGVLTETQSSMAKLRRPHLNVVLDILNNAKLKEIVNANIAVYIGAKSGREIT